MCSTSEINQLCHLFLENDLRNICDATCQNQALLAI